MDWHKFKTIGIKRSGIFAAILSCILGLWLIWELLQDSDAFRFWVSSQVADDSSIEIIIEMTIAIVITFFGVGIPVLFTLWFYRKLYANARSGDARLPVYKVLANEWEGPVGLFVVWLLWGVPLYLLAEAMGALSVIPLATPLCAILAAVPAYRIIKTTVPARRCMMIALVVGVVLATRYVDWYPSKSLLRDIFRIKAGVPVITVESIMANRRIGPAGQIKMIY